MGTSYLELKTRIEKIGSAEGVLNAPIFVNEKAVGAVVAVEELENEYELSIVIFNMHVSYEIDDSNPNVIEALYVDSESNLVSEI